MSRGATSRPHIPLDILGVQGNVLEGRQRLEDKNYFYLSKTRDLLISKRGNFEPKFKMQVQMLHKWPFWMENEKHIKERPWRNVSNLS